jgi:tetratricopeptide (TPR) repeat protein
MGSGGIGKTSVASAVINDPHIVQAFEDSRYWAPCDKTFDIRLLLVHLAHVLSVTLESRNILGDIISHLRKNNVPRIIFLDNFETLWEGSVETRKSSEQILSSLRSISNITIFLAMRGSIPPFGVQWTKLPLPVIGTLSLDAARNTFVQINPYYIDNQLDNLLRALDCWPLAVTLVARVGASGITPSNLLISWEREKSALLHSFDHPDRLESIEVSIQLSLCNKPMASDPNALALLSILARLPGGIRPEILLHVAPVIREVHAAKRRLLHAALAELTSDGTLKVLSPIRAYVEKYHPLNASDILALRRFYFQFVAIKQYEPGTEEFRNARETISREESNIRSVVMDALENEISVDAVQATLHYSHYVYWNVPSTEVLDKAIDSIRRHPSSELNSMMPHCLLILGRLSKRLVDFPGAPSSLMEARTRFESLGNLGGAAECCLHLASVYTVLPKHKEALDMLATARGYFNATDDLRGLSDYFEMLGRAHRKQGKFVEALAALNEAQTICTTLNDSVCTAIRTHTFGIVYRTQGNLEEAVAALNKADGYFTAFGPPYYVAETHYNLGIVYYMQQHYDQADKLLSQVYDSYKTIENHGVSWCLFHRGELNRRRGHFEVANNFFEKAKHSFKKVGWTEAIVYCLLGQARIFVALHKVDEAYQSCHEALTIIGDREGYDRIKEAMQNLHLCI